MRKDISVDVTEYDLRIFDGIVFKQVLSPYFSHVEKLALHIVRPYKVMNQYDPLPLLVWICGGRWQSTAPMSHVGEMVQYAKAGFVVASVDYRVSSKAAFPAMLNDVKAAIRYLRAHAQPYGIQASRVAVMGASAGATLAALVGLCPGTDIFPRDDRDEWCDQPDAVDAVVYRWGLADQLAAGPDEGLLLGGDTIHALDFARLASPITYVKAGAPPFLMFHGTADTQIPIAQSDRFYDALRDAGVQADYYRVEGAGHGTPEYAQPPITETIIAFLNQHLCS